MDNKTLGLLLGGLVLLGVVGYGFATNWSGNNTDNTDDMVNTDMNSDSTEDMVVDENMNMNDDASNSGNMNEGAGVMLGGATADSNKSISDNLRASADHTTVVDAAEAAGVLSTLGGVGSFTVFAPTNAAFDKLSNPSATDLMSADRKDQLTGILSYHVVPGRYTSGDLKDGMTLKTVQGQDLTFTMSNGKWMINNSATIQTADAVSSNGVIHSVDTVLMPR